MIENEEMIICGFIGEREVGKTTIINKYFKQIQSIQYNPTIAVEVSYCSYECDEGTLLRVKCWDTSGENKYKNMVCYHLKEADVIFILFDFTNKASFIKIDQWVNRMKNQKVIPKVLFLIGNKTDLITLDQSLRKISKKQALQKAKQIGATYVQISAINDHKFDFLRDAFQQILTERAQKLVEINKMKTNLDEQAMQRMDKNGIKMACDCTVF